MAVIVSVFFPAGWLESQAADLPLYQTSIVYSNHFMRLNGFNNAGDIAADGSSDQLDETPAQLLRGGNAVNLFSLLTTGPGTNLFRGLNTADITERNADGSVKILLNASQLSTGFPQPVVMTLNADGTATSTLLPPYVFPTGSQFPGQTNFIGATAINLSGLVVGGSGTAGDTYRWYPPYTDKPHDSFFEYGLAASPIDLDDQGRVLEYRGDPSPPTLIDQAGALTAVPAALGAGTAISGDYISGNGQGTNGSSRAFVWKIGDSDALQLPDPLADHGFSVLQSEADSVNKNGDVVGWVYLRLSPSTAAHYPVFWKRSGSSYSAYVLNQILPDENSNTNAPDFGIYPLKYQGAGNHSIVINDLGQIAISYNFNGLVGNFIAVLNPVTNGVVKMVNPSGSAYEEDGKAIVTVALTRSPGYTNAVSVSFATSNNTALAGQNFVATNGIVTWAPGESGPRDIQIDLIDDHLYTTAYPDFFVNLTSTAGAQMGSNNFSDIYIYEGPQSVQFVYAGVNDYNYNVAQGFGKALLTLERTGSGDGVMVVSNLVTYSGSALAGTHFVATTQNVSWAIGELGRKTVTINLLNGSLGGTTKSFYVNGSVYAGVGTTNVSLFREVNSSVNLVPTNQFSRPSIATASSYVQGSNLGFDFTGILGGVFAVEHSSNLTNWAEVLVLTNTTGVQHFTLSLTNQAGAHFYRTKFK